MEVIKWLHENENSAISGKDLEKLLSLLESVQFGSVTLIIKDGKVVQIEKSEKLRIK